jgi:hypothetical protein
MKSAFGSSREVALSHFNSVDVETTSAGILSS